MEKIKKFIVKYFSPLSLSFLAVFLISLLIQIVANMSAGFAGFINDTIGFACRIALASVSGILPISIGEILIILSPLAITVLIIITLKLHSERVRFFRFLITLLSVLSIFYTLYVFTLGVGYRTESVADKMSLSDIEPNRDSLYSTFLELKAGCEGELENIEYSEGGSSVSPHSLDKLSAELCLAYDSLAKEYPTLGLKSFNSAVKPVILSRGMTAIEITGIYTYFTGESNINTHFPDYTLPFTAAHELAHQRGIARENEANFIAFLVCIHSSDSYIRYSGYLNMLEYIASSLYKADKELCSSAIKSLDERLRGEIREYSEFYEENKNELLGSISKFFNDNYLKAQGTEGVISYGKVSELCVAYFGK